MIMTNISLFKKHCAINGISIQEIADKLGITKQAMYKKLQNKAEFKQSQIALIIEYLNLNDSECNAIFFGNEVEENSTMHENE